jgi:hypothetical protein
MASWEVVGTVTHTNGVAEYRFVRPTDRPQEYFKVCAVSGGYRAWAGGKVEIDE